MVDSTGGALRPGSYDEILTSRLEQALHDALASDEFRRLEPLNRAEAADRLALHAARLVERVVAALPDDRRVAQGSDLLRAVGERLAAAGRDADLVADLPVGDARVLRAVFPANPDGRPAIAAAPVVPLVDTTVLTNAPTEPSLSRVIDSEIATADHVDAVVAFIRYSGIRPLLDTLRRLTGQGRGLRVLTTTFTNSTQPEALEALAAAGAQIRVSYDSGANRLHAKAWLFRRDSGATTGLVGSSNLSQAGQVLGQEWNVRLSALRNPAAVAKLGAAFEASWHSPDFRDFDPTEFRRAVTAARRAAESPTPVMPLEIRLEPFQERLLEQVAAARAQGRHRNLLVAATGTGKTVMAAVDYARLRRELPRARLLFVAHREEILDQAMATFRVAVREPAFGERWVAGDRPSQFDHVFASVQSLTAGSLEHLPADHFDVVVVDEFHHAAAASYERFLTAVRPQELLGLTATPERADGMPILQWFDGRIAADLRLWDAIDQQYLVPFHYFGVHDGSDLRHVPWRRGRGYDPQALANVYSSDDLWARAVINQVVDHVGDVRTMRALGFCVTVGHARFMADVFSAAGIPARAVTAETPHDERRRALRDLRDGSLNAVFSVDLFNEGVDVPDVDTLLMLRPTESPVVFLQQLGRGLRRAQDKSVCTVLDFIGNHRQEFRFDARYRALLGVSRQELRSGITEGFSFLPTGCSFRLDRVAQTVVLDSLRTAVASTWPQRVAQVRLMAGVDEPVTLAGFLAETGLDLEDVYAGSRCWSDLLEAAGTPTLPAGPHERTLRRALGRMLHVRDGLRCSRYGEFLASGSPPQVTAELDRRLLRMLVILVAGQALGDEQLPGAAGLLWQHPQVLSEMRELLGVLESRGNDRVEPPVFGRPELPLRVHARYSREEVLAAFAQGERARVPSWREGVRWAADERADLLLVTLNKSSRTFSPSTQYRDYAISPTLFHWESQSTTGAASPTGRRYQGHEAAGSSVYLFVRLTNTAADKSYWFLGPATYVRHSGERPMAITWRLHRPLPGDLYAQFAAAAVA